MLHHVAHVSGFRRRFDLLDHRCEPAASGESPAPQRKQGRLEDEQGRSIGGVVRNVRKDT